MLQGHRGLASAVLSPCTPAVGTCPHVSLRELIRAGLTGNVLEDADDLR